MKICRQCLVVYRHQVGICPHCKNTLEETTLQDAFKLTEKKSFHKTISGTDKDNLSDLHKQYHLRSYIGNRSLFLDFDLHKNRLKHGRRLKRFFISPVNPTALFNIPWFFFNVISSNLFHMQHTVFCPACNAKHIPDQHTKDECEYNIEYFNILDDILNGRIVKRKKIYCQYALEKKELGYRSAYFDIFHRNIRWEIFWDILSITVSVLFWVYIAVYISWPMFKVLLQKLNHIDAYEWVI